MNGTGLPIPLTNQSTPHYRISLKVGFAKLTYWTATREKSPKGLNIKAERGEI